jgi:predicted transcriptional regulator
LTTAEKRRREKIETIQNLLKEGFSPAQIKEMLHTTYNSIRRYATGDPEKLCRFGGERSSELDNYQSEIIHLLQQNMPKNKALEQIQSLGYQGKRTAFEVYCRKLITELDIPYRPKRNAAGTHINPKAKSCKHYLSRSAVFKHFWSGKEIDEADLAYVLDKYPQLVVLQQCIHDFRRIYAESSVELLGHFIETYSACEFKPLNSFANGLFADLDAVKNSVTSPFSSGFVEGANNKIKVIKRLMYGRANVDLLRVRVLFAR